MSPSEATRDSGLEGKKIVLFANTDWYLFNFRLHLAEMLRRAGANVVLVSPPGRHGPELVSRGFRWLPLPFDRRSLHPLAQLRPVADLARLLRAERPALIHNFTIKCAAFGSVAARWTGIPAVNAVAGMGSIAVHGSGQHRVARRLALSALKLALGGTRVIVQNPDDRALLVREGIIRSSRCTVIRGSGVDLTRFRPVTGKKGPVRALFASRLLRSKGVFEFAAAAASIRGREGLSTVEFLVAGEADPGNPDSLSVDEVRSLQANAHLRFLGHVDDMVSLLETTSIVALPTRYGEGVPRILVEGAASGLPLVASDVAGCREIVVPDVNGYLVPLDEPTGLAEAIERLARDEALRARMGARSRDLAEERYSQEAVNSATLDVYRSALADKRAYRS